MEQIRVSLPDGSEKTVPRGTPVLEVARSLGPRLAREALVARVNGRLVDVYVPLTQDSSLVLITPGQPEALQVYRHSTAHLLAQAVQELFPKARVGIGPVTEEGFYYDFDKEEPFQPEDLARIEAKMRE